MHTVTDNPAQLLEKVGTFLLDIGISLHYCTLEGFCFLPGIQIIKGELYADPGQLKYPGDLLHEAGHIAVVPFAERHLLNEISIGERPMREAEEMMAIAWSYAACVYLNIDPYIVFHDDGYQQGGSSIADNFNAGHYFGVPMLQWTGMAKEKADPEDPGLQPYPSMLKWVRD
jgi:hypothetical protein